MPSTEGSLSYRRLWRAPDMVWPLPNDARYAASRAHLAYTVGSIMTPRDSASRQPVRARRGPSTGKAPAEFAPAP